MIWPSRAALITSAFKIAGAVLITLALFFVLFWPLPVDGRLNVLVARFALTWVACTVVAMTLVEAAGGAFRQRRFTKRRERGGV